MSLLIRGEVKPLFMALVVQKMYVYIFYYF
jgi:hypothetical protein